jgi:hypothetical protein
MDFLMENSLIKSLEILGRFSDKSNHLARLHKNSSQNKTTRHRHSVQKNVIQKHVDFPETIQD